MSTTSPALVETWRAEAELLRRRGASVQADVLESCAEDLARWLRERELETLTLKEAAAESGYSYFTLSRKITRGEIVNAGTPRSPRIRRCDLPGPRRSSSLTLQEGDPDVAGTVLRAGRGRRPRRGAGR